MDCKDCENYVSAYIDGELDQNLVTEFEQHISDCAGCQTLVQAEKRMKQIVVESYHPEKAPFSLRAGVRRELAKRHTKVGFFRSLFVRPAALIATTVVFLMIVSVAFQVYHSGRISDQLASNYKEQIYGEIDCINCYLANTEQAHKYCAEYGHYLGLVTDTGEIYSFIPNKMSRALQTHEEYAHNRVEISGFVYHNANFIEVENFKVFDQTVAVNSLALNTIIR